MKINVITAESAGFCFGVERAVQMCEQAAKDYKSCVMYGEITHNKKVLEEFKNAGVGLVHEIRDIPANTAAVIRAHGITTAEYEEMRRGNVIVIDATCPFVKKIHDIVRQAENEGYFPVIIGKREHAEVLGIAGQVKKSAVFANVSALREWVENTQAADKKLAVVFQTTLKREIFDETADFIKKVCTNVKIFDTICAATQVRYAETEALAKTCDLMVVIGDALSANSRGLFEIASKYCDRTYFVESAGTLPDFGGEHGITVGVTAGASTPASIIKEVNHKMLEESELIIEETTEQPLSETTSEQPAETAETTETTETATAYQETFEEMLEKSIKTLHTGEKVTGIVAAITPTEVSVDLGIKQSGYIPLSELTDDPTKTPDDIVKIGEEIEAFVMRVNDVEGTVQLSRRRLDAIKNWADIEQAMKDRTIVEGFVTEENKGGIVVMVRGIRVFVPASRTGLPREAPMTELVKKPARLIITEVNQSRRRVVGSISAVMNEERKARAEKVWSEIEAGKKYRGIVKSMTTYGAFVDIGGVDGMVHKSELSWARIRQPSDILNIGDEIDVFIISYDPEKRKISLGCKDRSSNPWDQFTAKYGIGDVATVKVVKLMKYGAFAEILPGVDGLIHVSQIADHHVGEPGDVLSEGQVVGVKITDIDFERKKISLSIRALLSEPGRNEKNNGEPEVVYDTETPEAYDGDESGEQ